MVDKEKIAENRFNQGLTPIPDYELRLQEMIECRMRSLRRDSTTTAIMFFLVGILVALVLVIVLLEVSSVG